MKKAIGWVCAAAGTASLALMLLASPVPGRSTNAVEVVVTGVPRPLELVRDGQSLVVLSPGARGDAAGELYRVALGEDAPVDLAHQPHMRLPFMDRRLAAFGSMAIEPGTRDLLLGEENGTRVYRLGSGDRLTLQTTGLHRLPGGSAIAFDAAGRLILVDYADPALVALEDRASPELEQFRQEDYRGPLVFRLAPDPLIPLPRRLDVIPPLFPRAWGGRAGGGLLPHIVSVAPVGGDDLLLLTSRGAVYKLTADGRFALFARLPGGQYNRTHMVAAPDGAVFVSGGFQVGALYQVAPDGSVLTVASNLADPEGIALDDQGRLYLAESSFHRIIRLRPF
jgi:hypothetical protein